MSVPRPPSLRLDLPFRRIALVLSGGGALGAYEVGVLKVLEATGIRPAIMAGVSVGAINAVLWLAHGLRTAPLERVWARLSPSAIGMRWLTLLGRMAGAIVMAVAAVQLVLTLAGSPELSPFRLFVPLAPGRGGLSGALLDALAWLLVAVAGLVIARGSRRAEETLTRLSPFAEGHDLHQLFGALLLTGLVVHVLTWGMGVPWPHRFSASVLLIGGLVWFLNRPGRAGDRVRQMVLRLAPETGGRGLWGSDTRRRLIQRVVQRGDPGALVDGGTHLVISACEIGSGRMNYFVNWNPTPEFRERIAHAIGEVVPLHRPQQVIEAAVASSALPAIFEPVRLGDREYVDGGVFSNQPLHAVLADDADAILVVLVSPSGGPATTRRDPHLVELGGRLLEIANWRNLQTELRGLPPGWSPRSAEHPGRAGGAPARVCVVEPESQLPGGLYGFSPTNAAELERRGERDAWEALEAAGWLASPVRDPQAPSRGEGHPAGREGPPARSDA